MQHSLQGILVVWEGRIGALSKLSSHIPHRQYLSPHLTHRIGIFHSGFRISLSCIYRVLYYHPPL